MVLSFQEGGRGQFISNEGSKDFKYEVKNQEIIITLTVDFESAPTNIRMVFPALCVANSLSLFVIRGKFESNITPAQFMWESLPSRYYVEIPQGAWSYSHGYSNRFSPPIHTDSGSIKHLSHSVDEGGSPHLEISGSFELSSASVGLEAGIHQLTLKVRRPSGGSETSHIVPYIYSDGSYGLYPITKETK